MPPSRPLLLIVRAQWQVRRSDDDAPLIGGPRNLARRRGIADRRIEQWPGSPAREIKQEELMNDSRVLVRIRACS
ncbi:MAG: hypothetical protein ACREUF_15100, partial [Solimonas sp.]